MPPFTYWSHPGQTGVVGHAGDGGQPRKLRDPAHVVNALARKHSVLAVRQHEVQPGQTHQLYKNHRRKR